MPYLPYRLFRCNMVMLASNDSNGNALDSDFRGKTVQLLRKVNLFDISTHFESRLCQWNVHKGSSLVLLRCFRLTIEHGISCGNAYVTTIF